MESGATKKFHLNDFQGSEGNFCEKKKSTIHYSEFKLLHSDDSLFIIIQPRMTEQQAFQKVLSKSSCTKFRLK